MAAMIPLAVLGLRTHFVMDLLSEMPADSSSARSLDLVLEKYDPGMTGPLAIVLSSDRNLKSSEGLALIDDGFPVPELQVRIGPFRVDMLFDEARLVLEADGAHRAERLEHDQRR